MTSRRRLLRLGAVACAAPVLAGCAVAEPPAAVTPTPPPTAPPPPSPTPAPPPTATAVPAPPTVAPSAPTAVAPTAAPPPAPTAAATPSDLRVVTYAETGRREVALTFDAGSDRGNAEAILDLLASEGILASFGIMGEWAEANPDLLQRMANEGHLLFNHSWNHPSFTGATTGEAPLTPEEQVGQVRKTEEAVARIAGVDLRPWFRPPYGDYDAPMQATLAAAGYPVLLLWSCDSRDSLGATGDEIMANCVDNARPGRIVLLHVGAQSAASDTLPRIVASLRGQGFAFARVDDLLAP